MNQDLLWNCPVLHSDLATVTQAHGGGGSAMHRLLHECFFQAFNNPILEQQGDAAVVTIGGLKLAFTTDSFVVQPLFFPGGDIGALSIYGTVNDLAMHGARPLYLSAAFILEEGLPIETLQRVTASMAQAAHETGVAIATGDTKVIQRVHGDELLINTAGIGLVEAPAPIGYAAIRPGDVILVSGDLGRHGVAVMTVREGLEFESTITSDAAPLAETVLGLLRTGIHVHCLRDLTRGGLASALNELAKRSGYAMHICERAVPVHEEVRGACEVLGLDPLYVANEGRFVAFVPAAQAECALGYLQNCAPEQGAAIIGTVLPDTSGMVTMESAIGATRVLDMLSGEQLPRIC